MTKSKCKYCGYELERKNMKKHLEKCDEKPGNPGYKDLKGLGGWLIFVQIGFIIAALEYLISAMGFLLSRDFIFGSLFLFLFLFESFILFLMYSRDKKFPAFAIAGLWIPYVLLLILILTTGINWETIGGLIFYLLPVIIWTGYFKESKRVKQTFTKEKIKFE